METPAQQGYGVSEEETYKRLLAMYGVPQLGMHLNASSEAGIFFFFEKKCQSKFEAKEW